MPDELEGMCMEAFIMNWIGSGRKWPWPVSDIIPAFV
jgi:hypothetical protein